MGKWVGQGKRVEGFPTIHIMSDSAGTTAVSIALAAASLFGNVNPAREVYSNVASADEAYDVLTEHLKQHREMFGKRSFVLYYSAAIKEIHKAIKRFASENDEVICVNVLDGAIKALIASTGQKPSAPAGTLRQVNDVYMRRIEAMEFTIEHDDGRNAQDLSKADIVLIGVSRSGKTPLSIYLAQLGYKVANIPLDPVTEPPQELFTVESTRIFGLMIGAQALQDIRKKRLGNAQSAARSYAEIENIYDDLEKARALMRRLGCIVVHTENRAIEETAQEILGYYITSHPDTDFENIR